ncbi:MAG TPA: hypothetical protein VN699_21360 [Pirellulales bacterium]|nr:hypothetical protein [Pirellulales bacterium]
MAHPLEAKIGAIRRRAHRLVWTFSLSRLLTALVAVLLTWGVVDYLVRFQDRGVRIIGSAVALAVLVWAVYRCHQTVRRARFRDLDVALRIERRFPELQDRLASAWQFLRERADDPEAGSAALRRAVIGQTVAEVEGLDLSKALEPAPARRALVAAATIACLTLAVAALHPNSTRVALSRLFNPFNNTAWPQVHHLAVKDPVHRLAAGQPFEVAVVDADGVSLPEQVWLHIRYQEGEGASPSEIVEPMRFVNDEMLARKESVSKPFAYRAVGGDDNSMPWIELEVIEPPTVGRLTVTLHYPEYTSWPSENSERHIRALTGTRVEMTGRATKPLSSASLEIDGGPSIPVQIAADGLGFSAPAPGGPEFVVEKSGAYWIKLADRDGFSGGEQVRYEIRALEDLSPSVTLEEPAANIFVTPAARVPLRVAAKDDLALKQVAIYFSRSDKSDVGDESFTLYEGPPRIEKQAAARRSSSTAASGESRTFEHRWDLGPLGLKPGVQLNVYASATDYRPLVGHSQPRRLTVITANELAERLAERQNFVLGELARMLKLQREAREQVSGLEIQLREIGALTKQDLDHLQGAELIQRQVDRGLVSPGEGVASQITGLLADLTNNRVDSPDVERHMRRLLAEVNRLGEQELPLIGRDLTAALKSSQADLGKAAAHSLTSAGEHQDQVIQSLEKMLGELSQWDNYRRFHREIGQLRHDQEAINEQTAELGGETLTKDFKDLAPQQQADLKKLAGRQLELSRLFDKVQQRMERMAAELEDHDPLAAGTISDALSQAREQAIAGKMRETGRQLGENQLGQAEKGQRQLAEQLQEVLDILANRREHELSRLVKKLKEAEQKLTRLRGEQEGLRKKWESAQKLSGENERRRELERLTREQKELQQQAERLARQLERLQAQSAGRSAARGGAKMNQAGQQAQQGAAQEAAEQAAAAQKDLDDAQRQLAETRREAEQDLADEQLARLEDSLKSVAERQAQALAEARRYDELHESQGELTRAQSISVGDLARQQRAIEEETRGFADKLAAKAFEFSLDRAARQMAAAAALLDRRQTGAPAQQTMQQALARLGQLLDALQPDEDDEQQPQQEESAGGGEQGQGKQPQDGARLVAELKLLKLMQAEINQQTKALEDARRETGDLTAEQKRAYAELSEEQGKLADVLLDLVQADESNPEDDPENLPQPQRTEGGLE